MQFHEATPAEVEQAFNNISQRGSCCDADYFGDGTGYRVILFLRIPKGPDPYDERKRIQPELDNYMTYVEVVFTCDQCPTELTEYINNKKLKEVDDLPPPYNEKKKISWIYTNVKELKDNFGYDFSNDRTANTRRTAVLKGELAKLGPPPSSTGKPTKIDASEAATLLRNSAKTLMFVGSGVSAAAGFEFGKQGEANKGQERGVAVDNYVKAILAGGNSHHYMTIVHHHHIIILACYLPLAHAINHYNLFIHIKQNCVVFFWYHSCPNSG